MSTVIPSSLRVLHLQGFLRGPLRLPQRIHKVRGGIELHLPALPDPRHTLWEASGIQPRRSPRRTAPSPKFRPVGEANRHSSASPLVLRHRAFYIRGRPFRTPGLRNGAAPHEFPGRKGGVRNLAARACSTPSGTPSSQPTSPLFILLTGTLRDCGRLRSGHVSPSSGSGSTHLDCII